MLLALCVLLAVKSVIGSVAFVSFRVDGRGNNERQVMSMAFITCRVMGPSLCAGVVIRGNSKYLASVFDFATTRELFPVFESTDALAQTYPGIKLHSDDGKCCFVSKSYDSTTVLRSHAAGLVASGCNLLLFCGTYCFLHGIFATPASYVDEDEKTYVGAALRSIRWNRVILEFASMLRDHLPAEYTAMHYRAGDRSPLPILNCSANGYARALLSYLPCTHKADPVNGFVTFEEVYFMKRRTGPLYIATDSFDDHRYKLFYHYMTKVRGIPVVFQKDLIAAAKMASPALFATRMSALEARGPVDPFSWVDQLMCIDAYEFIGHSHSTWTENVVLQRHFLQRKDHEQLWADFSDMSVMFDVKTGALTYHGDGVGGAIVPNFVAACPTGTTVSGTHCCCNGGRCVGDKCAMVRSPMNYKIMPAFRYDCVGCYCDPPIPV